MNKIKLRQICFLFAGMMPLTKMIVYPAMLAYQAKNDLLFAALGNFLLEGAVIALLMLLASRTDCTFFDLLQNTFGKIAAKIIYGLFAAFFLFSAILPILEQKTFVLQVFYENVPSFLSFAPFFAVSFFASVKGFKSIGRAADLALPVTALSLAVILLLSVPQAEFSALLPIGGTGIRGIFSGSLYGLNWYTDCLYPLFFLGHFKYEKHAAGKVMLSYAAGSAVVLLFLAIFYGIFSDIALRQINTIAQISKYTTAYTTLGRIDLFFIFAAALPLVFYLCVPAQMCVHCIRKIAPSCNPIFPAAIVNGAMLIAAIFLNYSFLEVQTLFTQKLWWVFALFCYAVPVLSLLLKRSKGDSRHE